MSYLFDFALYAIAIASVLALYGSTSKASKIPAPVQVPAPAPTPEPSADVALVDFDADLSEAAFSEEAIAEVLAEIFPVQAVEPVVPAPAPALTEDCVVPFRRRPVPAPTPDWAKLTAAQLRKECAQRGIKWRNGQRPLKKSELVAALSA